MGNAKTVLPKIEYARDMYSVADGADLLIVLTDWNDFKEIDLGEIKKRMKTLSIIDTRNIYEPSEIVKAGFSYIGVGR